MDASSTTIDDPYQAVAWHVNEILKLIGEDPTRPGLQDTGMRVAKMYLDELSAGYRTDTSKLFTLFEPEKYNSMVLVKDIPFYSLCEHHMVPFHGVAHIGYIPNDSVIGLSKLARIVKAFSRRLQVQERLTEQIADLLYGTLKPKGVMVVISAEHLCMAMRGVQTPGTTTVTSAVRGVFDDVAELGPRTELLGLLRG